MHNYWLVKKHVTYKANFYLEKDDLEEDLLENEEPERDEYEDLEKKSCLKLLKIFWSRIVDE